MDNEAFEMDCHGNVTRTKEEAGTSVASANPRASRVQALPMFAFAQKVADDPRLSGGGKIPAPGVDEVIELPSGPHTTSKATDLTMDTAETALFSLIEADSVHCEEVDEDEMTGKTWPQTRKEKQILVGDIPESEIDFESSPQHTGGGDGVNGRIGNSTSDLRVNRVIAEPDDGRRPDRATWGKKADFLLSVIGFAVDLGNVWRFPYICYKNGGGAFLVPYALMAVFGGIPFLYMEMALGQYQGTGSITVWRRICPIMEGIGYAICIINLFVGFYYSTIIAWSLYYLIASFATTLPWTNCDNPWNTEQCQSPFEGNFTNGSVSPATEFYFNRVLSIHESDGIGDVGGVKWDLALCLLLIFTVVYFSIWKGIRASGKVVWVTATLPYICLFVLLIRGVTLDGALDGIIFYLNPRWELLLNAGVWVDAAVQVFFSLGPGFGVILAFSSYNKLNNNCFHDALLISTINCLTSFVAGFAIFSILGFMANSQNKGIEEVTPEGPGLIFIAIPEAITQLPGSTGWAILFFIMIITLGLDSTFGGLESIVTAWCDRNPKTIGKHRELFVLFIVCTVFLGSLSTVTYGGQHVILLLENFGASTTLLLVVILEAVSVTWFYGLRRFTDDIRTMIGYRPSVYWQLCWCILSPAMLLFIVVFGLAGYEPLAYPDGVPYPAWSMCVGWLLTVSSMICLPAFAVYKVIVTPGGLRKRLVIVTNPQELPDHKYQLDRADAVAI